MIGRRGFLKLIGAGVVGLSLAMRTPEPETVFGVDFSWDAIESALTLDEDRIQSFYLRPAMASIAREWDQRAAMFVDAEVWPRGSHPSPTVIEVRPSQRWRVNG